MNSSKPYNLEERTLEFGKRIIRLAKTLENSPTNRVLVSQIVRSGTSLGSNYREANETETKRDFAYRIRICRKEAKETLYWLRIIAEANPALRKRIEPLAQETNELKKIFAAIALKSK